MTDVRLGLGANWRQFWLLVLINAFVGAMVGLERHLVPLMAEPEFGVASRTAALGFLVSFGIVKALSNLFAGRLGDLAGRKWVLVIGWLAGVPVPLLLIWAPTWSWVVVANLLLGVNQGLCWSMTVVMKIDLVGPARRGFAMGLNEFAGYLAVALATLAAGLIAERYGLRPEPFYLGLGFVTVGLALSLLFARDTREHVALEARQRGASGAGLGLRRLLLHETLRDPALSSCNQAGLVNNLNDGAAWGLFPLLFAGAGLSLTEIGVLAAAYPATWGFCQLVTGALSDRVGRKWLIAGGLGVQALALLGTAVGRAFADWTMAAVLLGLGTAMVYPTLLAAVGDVAHPTWRATALGVYRLWRDSGYALGALAAGALADLVSIRFAIGAVGVVTLGSGVLVAIRMPETMKRTP
ncbi:MAG TPA: MFS transporter [Gemmatimonadales bacterium]|nr:MFS transporter [Gemmatimonadales bacterium]